MSWSSTRWKSLLRTSRATAGISSILLKLGSVVPAGLAAVACAPKTAVLHQPAEGDERAADRFRKASSLRPQRCEYSLHLAEAPLPWNKS
jgi:hypothetical protein